MSIQVASGKLNFSVHTVLCDVSIQKKVCNEKIMTVTQHTERMLRAEIDH